MPPQRSLGSPRSPKQRKFSLARMRARSRCPVAETAGRNPRRGLDETLRHERGRERSTSLRGSLSRGLPPQRCSVRQPGGTMLRTSRQVGSFWAMNEVALLDGLTETQEGRMDGSPLWTQNAYWGVLGRGQSGRWPGCPISLDQYNRSGEASRAAWSRLSQLDMEPDCAAFVSAGYPGYTATTPIDYKHERAARLPLREIDDLLDERRQIGCSLSGGALADPIPGIWRPRDGCRRGWARREISRSSSELFAVA